MSLLVIPQQVKGLPPTFGKTTIFVMYRMPDFPNIIHPFPFTWQYEDECPTFPRTNEFLNFWQQKLEALVEYIHIAHEPHTLVRGVAQLKFEGRLN